MKQRIMNLMARRDKRFWRAPSLWPRGECFIIGGGPSVKHFDIDKLQGRRTLAVNMAFRLRNWFDVMFFGDCRYYAANYKELNKFAGLKVTTCEQHFDKLGIKVIQRKNGQNGLSTDQNMVWWNLSSGACAINLAVHFGVKRIVLLGFDMQAVDGDDHWHDLYLKQGAKPSKGKGPYPRFMKPFAGIAAALKRVNVECVIVGPTMLDVFPKVKFEDAV